MVASPTLAIPNRDSSSNTQSSTGQSASEPVHVDYDVAIVGGGIAGLTLAAALQESGLSIVLIEAQPMAAQLANTRAYAISLLSSRIFQGLGVWENLVTRIETFRSIRLSDADYAGVVQFEPQDLGTETLGYVATHQVLSEVLQQHLQQHQRVSWLCPATLETVCYRSNFAEMTIVTANDTRQLRVRLLVAADGAKSGIRQAAGIQTRGWKYWQSCITCKIQPEQPHRNIAYERFWPSGPFAILPMPNNLCQIVWTAPHADAHAFAALTDDEFLTTLQQRYGSQMGQLSLASERRVFPVQLMQSDRYTMPRLALIGDAAHCCHPVGGQGLNLGIRDAAVLAEVLQSAHQQGQDIGQAGTLRRYGFWRRYENLIILGFTDFLDRTFSNDFPPLVLIRRTGLWLLGNCQPVKVFALRLMTGLSGRQPRLPQPAPNPTLSRNVKQA